MWGRAQGIVGPNPIAQLQAIYMGTTTYMWAIRSLLLQRSFFVFVLFFVVNNIMVPSMSSSKFDLYKFFFLSFRILTHTREWRLNLRSLILKSLYT